ncbi:hypothetical protein [Lignipirellula cremea]|uniref:Uncharacterized protein n=1 Tax=Lignipirellula cremea TaxID=2528010 RepID=A0A518DWA0_9BACT|nr:hypothetical protein [Lignipirellula cremea]QDU96115.1 hypothetical protein Pla8534_39340 [Lignipirellula cremea]
MNQPLEPNDRLAEELARWQPAPLSADFHRQLAARLQTTRANGPEAPPRRTLLVRGLLATAALAPLLLILAGVSLLPKAFIAGRATPLPADTVAAPASEQPLPPAISLAEIMAAASQECPATGAAPPTLFAYSQAMRGPGAELDLLLNRHAVALLPSTARYSVTGPTGP